VVKPLVFVGYDWREHDAFAACCNSLRHHSPNVIVERIDRHHAWYARPTEFNSGGQLVDVISGAPMSTDFSLARFLVPLIALESPALFCDGDFLWRAPVEELFGLFDSRYAVQVVKHEHVPTEAIKMDGQQQTAYARKNWSSLMLFNVDHAIWNSFSEEVNTARGLDLHQFRSIPDELIGDLPVEWNWLEGVNAAIAEPKAVHFTRGIPSMPGYEQAAYADEWRSYAGRR
jgi:hypothetical protein